MTLSLSAASKNRFVAYDCHVPTRVPWLERIPSTWSSKKLKFLACLQGGGTPDKSNPEYWDGDIPWVSPKDMTHRWINSTEDHISQIGLLESATRMVPAGSVLIVVRSGILKHTIPVGIAVTPCALNQDMKAILPSRELDAEYFAWLVEGCQKALLFEWRKTGATVESLELELIAGSEIPLPPLSEQRAIAAFLDRETARIDELIAKKLRLIELLDEKRTALISQAVTKGMDSGVPMKESGVQWLGLLPAHWRITRLKHAVPGVTVGIVITPSKYYEPEGVPCLRSLNISTGVISPEDLVFISPESNELLGKSKLRSGDLVVVRTGKAGTAAIVTDEYHDANCIDLLIVRRSDQIRSRFLYYLLNSHATRAQVEADSVGAIQAHYNTSTLGDLIVALPPLEEQDVLIRHLDVHLHRLNHLSDRIQDVITRLREYRTAKITAAVTGQIDVSREVA